MNGGFFYGFSCKYINIQSSQGCNRGTLALAPPASPQGRAIAEICEAIDELLSCLGAREFQGWLVCKIFVCSLEVQNQTKNGPLGI